MIFRVIFLIYLLIRYNCFFIIFPFLFDSSSKRQAKRFVKFLEKSGSTFIKLGQMLSTRVDYFSETYLNELYKLKDNVRVSKEIDLKKLIRKELNKDVKDIFRDINLKAFSSASIACIYKGVLLTGEMVAIKVIKPDIEKVIKRDIGLLSLLCKLFETFSKRGRILKPTKIIKVLQENIKKELDLRYEAASMDQMRENFKKDDNIIIPEVYWELVSKNILVEGWIEDAIKIGDIKQMKENNLDLINITKNFTRLFFFQVLRDGFFHGDIHQGNLFITKDEKIIFIDFGIMGSLDFKLRFYLFEVFSAFLNKDYQKAAQIHFDAGWVEDSFKVEDFALACRSIVEKIINLKQNDISIGDLLAQLLAVSSNFNMTIQEDLLLLQKNLAYLENIGRQIVPEQNMWLISKEVLNNDIRKIIGYKQYGKKIFEDIQEEVFKVKEIFVDYNKLLQQSVINKKKSDFKLFIFMFIVIIILLYKL